MARPARRPSPVTCPTCGWVSQGAPHYCQKCGLDFWRSAADVAAEAARPLPGPMPTDTRWNKALVTGGIAGLLAAAIGTTVLVMGGARPEERPIVQTRPSRGPEAFLVERFFREARSPYAAFTFVVEGTIRRTEPAGPDIAVTESMTIDGDDWMAVGTMTTDGDGVGYAAAEVDGRSFAREAGADWTAVEADDEPMSPFARISTVGEVDYVGLETVNGISLHHLVATKWPGAGGAYLRAGGFAEASDRDGRFDIWVNDDGVPIRARQVATLTVSAGGSSFTFAVDMRLTFRDWGAVAPIERPA